ncbi:YceI family protein [Neolewinella antarctica]|uniref:Polyisoprenoid-binding protein YceI n=1 Tax=Neolewinella antarctica TaxID=442734 RepID=A0ABX0X7R2_9BACT|nr:YceI family protein [Neolewinella antarctica]NJC25256.1 polyisoprenoid-binding protein YceI [Neolewinella antarctica]
MRALIVILVTFLVSTAVFALHDTYAVGDNFSVLFATQRAEGNLYGLRGTVIFDPGQLSSASVDVTVDASTISTGNDAKDRHARGGSWLDVDNHPAISFNSEAFTAREGGFLAKGRLTLRGVDRAVTIPFGYEEARDNSPATLTGSFEVNRHDYGIDGPALVGGLVGDEVTVTLRVPVTK